jgi:tRNA-splicing endonuclease subunit Sen34
MANRIPIHVSNHTAFVWDVDHIATLRSQHKICGVLTGTLPHLSQQNVFLGLPLVLMAEELVLLVEKRELLVPLPCPHFPFLFISSTRPCT